MWRSVRETLETIKKYNPYLGAFISFENQEKLYKQAEESDIRWENNCPKSLIDGIPIAVKDNIHVQGLNTTCASKILSGYKPPFDATVVRFIKEKGAL